MGREGVPRLRLVVVADDDTGPRLCSGCGGPLMPSAKAAAVFCSSACRSRHWRRMRRAQARTEAVKVGAMACCPECGASWTIGVDRLVSATYCSPRCRKRSWHRRRTQPGGCEAAHPAVTGPLRAPGPARSMQLRATARKHRRADHRAVKAEAKDSSKARR
ncbi:hypothetical protein [Streptomyces bluensis]|uniref:Uncharacterized protein n=1 Tax=Streptomyces bluensis TaxID=33897 RepID=A0ABW6UHH4_9ACTN